MATPQELRKKAEQAQKTRELATKKALEIVNQARKIKGHEPISEEEYTKKREPREAKKYVPATNVFEVEEKPIMVKNIIEEGVNVHMEQDDDSAWGVVSSIDPALENIEAPDPYVIHHSELKQKNPQVKATATETLNEYAKKLSEQLREANNRRSEDLWRSNNPYSPRNLVVNLGEPEVAVTSDYVETSFKFTTAERNNRIKADPNLPKVFSGKKEGETNGNYYSRMVKEEEIRTEYIKKKNKELDELEEKINDVMYPIEIVVTDENEEFCINAFELADNLAMTELEKDPTFSLDENTELYNKTYNKYMKLISSFKLEKNA